MYVAFLNTRLSIHLEKFFFPSTILEQNKLDFNVCNYETLPVFEKNILPFSNSSFGCYISKRNKCIIPLRLELGYNWECNSKYICQDAFPR